jgi:hypothetical protein
MRVTFCAPLDNGERRDNPLAVQRELRYQGAFSRAHKAKPYARSSSKADYETDLLLDEAARPRAPCYRM